MPLSSLYVWDPTGEMQKIPGTRPAGSTGYGLFAQRKDKTWDVKIANPDAVADAKQSILAAGGLHLIDEHKILPDDVTDVTAWADAWLVGIRTWRDAYRRAVGRRNAAYHPLIYNFPAAPFDVSTVPVKNWVYDKWLKNYAAVLAHPLSNEVEGLLSCFYRDRRKQGLATWTAESDRQLADLRYLHRGTGVRLVVCLSGVAELQPDGIKPEPPEVSGESVAWARRNNVPAAWWWSVNDVPADVTRAHCAAVRRALTSKQEIR